MQIRAEEQDDADKLNISLMGKRDHADPNGEVSKNEIMSKVNGKYPDFPQQVGTKERNKEKVKNKFNNLNDNVNDIGLKLPSSMNQLK